MVNMDCWKIRLAVGCVIVMTVMILEMLMVMQKNSLPLAIHPIWSSLCPLPTKRLPTCLIIGVRKGGTRALIDSMALHPQIRAAKRELHFFDRNTTYQLLGEKWYREQIPISFPDHVVVEKSPSYFTNSLVPSRVKRFNPRMKMILIVRDPVVRTISDFTQVQQVRKERNKSIANFDEAVFLPGSGEINPDYKPVRNSLYAIHFSRWLEHFPLEQFLILDGDNFIIDPLAELKQVERFLGLAAAILPSQFVFDERKGFFCFRRLRSRSPKCLGGSKGRRHVPIGHDSRKRLATQLRPYNEQFFAQVNRSFPHWQLQHL